MDGSFELLEEKVRKAADLVKRLRRENKSLEEDLTRARGRLQDAEKRLDALEKERGSEHPKELEALKGEVKALKQEREEVRNRIAKLVEVLDSLD